MSIAALGLERHEQLALPHTPGVETEIREDDGGWVAKQLTVGGFEDVVEVDHVVEYTPRFLKAAISLFAQWYY
jgi:hypothetical protein